MSRLAAPLPPVSDIELAQSIAAWLRRVPTRMIVELADSEGREVAAEALSELIVAELTMAYPELVEMSAPPLPF